MFLHASSNTWSALCCRFVKKALAFGFANCSNSLRIECPDR